MNLPHLFQRLLSYLWEGPVSLQQSLRLEWRFVALRWFGIFIMVPGLLLANLPPSRLLEAYAVLGLAAIYNLTIQLMLLRRPQLFVSGYLTAIGDGVLNVAMINVGGGFDSPFYYLLFTVALGTAMRYGYGPSLAMVLSVVCLDWLWRVFSYPVLDATFLFRSSFLVMTAVLASYLRGQAREAEAALQKRLRQASLLNEATAMLGASLDVQPVLRAIAAATCHLYGGNGAVIQLSAGLDETTRDAGTTIHYPETLSKHTTLVNDLSALCGRYSTLMHQPGASNQSVYQRTLASGQQVVALVLTPPERHSELATLAVSMPPNQSIPHLDPDILASFVERATLAIEKASLYRTLASRTDDLQRAYRDLAIAHQDLLSVDEMKTNFLANVSHELRTPLSSIRSFSELLLSYEDEPSIQQEFIQIINLESERLTRLVNDVLDISKIEAGKMDWLLTTVDVPALLHDSARSYAALIPEHGLAFEQDISPDLPQIYADRDRLQQVISNLLNNAMKFTPQGRVRLSAARVGDEIHISVADTGVGIAPEDHERIFEKFHQVGDTLTDKPRGTGLGLCICRDIVAYHQGRLWVESQLGAGSTFTFSIPIMAESRAATTSRSVAA